MFMTQSKLKIYKSSAGSGKTTILVYEYLNIILPQPDKFSRILAITFTNKAANEMKQRIISYLQGIIKPDDHNEQLPAGLRQQIEESLKTENKDIEIQAEICLNKILHSYSDFAVSTIDSFVYRIIRSFAKDLELSWDFDVELDTDEMFSEIIDMLMEDFGHDEFLTRQLLEMVEDKLNEGRSWKIEKEILSVSKQLLESEARPHHMQHILEADNKDIEELRKSLSAKNMALLRQAKSIAQKAIWILENNNISPYDLAHGKTGIGGYIQKIATTEPDKVFSGNKNAEAAVSNQCLYSKSKPDKLKAQIDEITTDVISCYEKLCSITDQSAVFYGRESVLRNLHVLSVLKSIKEKYEEVKEENGLLPISEFARSIARVTLTEDIPYIYERLGEKYQHFFIDEFQDTSTLQWENVLPLIENALAQNKANLLVGDVKQAIYRFRGGNIEQMGKMPEPPSDIVSDLSLNRYHAIRQSALINKLDTNFRSRKEIVDFNNDFFSFIKDQLEESQQDYYNEHIQKSTGREGGLVNISMYNEKDEHLQRVLEITGQLLTEGFNLKDIAILCRKNSEAQKVAVFLMKNTLRNPQSGAQEPIRVISDESLTLKQSPAVNNLIAFARLIDNPNDSMQLAAIMHFVYEQQNPDQNFHDWFTDLRSKYGNKTAKYLIHNGYDIRFEQLHHLDLYNLFEHIALTMKLDALKDPYIQFFLDEVLDFSRSKSVPVIREFLKWWDKKGKNKSIISPEGTDAVQVKTIHKSKGLAFPVVIYPFATENSGGSSIADYQWVETRPLKIEKLKSAVVRVSRKPLSQSVFSDVFNKEMHARKLDMINLLYVCMTRPRERLYIISSFANNTGDDPFMSLKHVFTSYFRYKNIEGNTLEFPAKPVQRKFIPRENEFRADINQISYARQRSWQEKLYISKPATKNILPDDSPAHTGTLAHHYLSKIIYQGHLPRVVSLIRNEIDDDKLASQIIAMISNTVEHKKLNPLFRTAENRIIRNEADILAKDEILRPDRIIIDPAEITIVEYKTGSIEKKHETQINEYAHKLNSMYQRPVKKMLVYISEIPIINEII